MKLKTLLTCPIAFGLAVLALLSAPQALAKAVFLNEVFASNATFTYGDTTTPDWVEFYNSSPYDVDLSGMSLTTDPTNPRRWVFPEGTTIKAGRFLVIYCDGEKGAAGPHTGFNLSANGDAVYFYDAALTLIDSVNFGVQIEDYSIGRQQHDTDSWTLTDPSLGSANTVVPLGNPANLRVNEWMADPASGSDWFELYNLDAKPVALTGLYLSNALKKNPKKFPIAPNSFIGTGSHAFHKFIADEDTAAGANHVNFKLSKAGDEIGIFPEIGAAIDSVTFLAQATGASEGRFPDGSAAKARFATTASPGASNYLPITNVLINEVLTHTDWPMEDSVELHNPSGTAFNISGWYLSDSAGNFKKYAFPAGSVVPAFGYLVTHEAQWTNTAHPFNFNSSEGDWVYLSAADTAGNLTGFRAQIKFGPAPNGISFGRYTNSLAIVQYPLQSALTLGTNNSGPLVGPVVVSEIMYYPPPLAGSTNDNVLDEYLELHNITTTNVPLFSPTEPTNAWRIQGAISFLFPTNRYITPGGYLVVVSFDPSTNQDLLTYFQQKYQLSTNIPILGPYSGKLANSGDSVQLEAPDKIQGRVNLNAGFVPYYLVEQIDYLSVPTWPTTASATGQSIQRKDVFRFGNEPTNWLAAAPSPGKSAPGGFTDHDYDGLADDWELRYGLNYQNPNDATLDTDNDGLINLQEYAIGTDPTDPNSALRLNTTMVNVNGATLRLDTEPGRFYTIQYRQDFSAGSFWQTLMQVNAPANGGPLTIIDTNAFGLPRRFYRVLVP